MKIVGFILIGLQVLAYMSGNIKIHDGPISSMLGQLLGSNIFAIIGIVFIVQATNKEKKNQTK